MSFLAQLHAVAYGVDGDACMEQHAASPKPLPQEVVMSDSESEAVGSQECSAEELEGLSSFLHSLQLRWQAGECAWRPGVHGTCAC